MSNIRTRFAPSPTGFLHIGSLRTVLFAYLIAKSQGGKLILRIEDTDKKREVKGAVEKLIKILDWVGIKFDEGPGLINDSANDIGDYGPYIQTKRIDIYKKYADKLLATGHAYRCFCSAGRLQKMRAKQEANKMPPRYDRHCRDLSDKEISIKLENNEPFVIRQKHPKKAEVICKDELRGELKFQTGELEDNVLIKSNGIPTYHFAVVVDDHLMEISHVLRGEEWIPSFPKHVLLYKAFGWSMPKFIHMPLTLNKEGGKLSKRQGDVTVESYKDAGYLPEALINFNALMGWSPYSQTSNEQATKDKNIEILSLSDLVEKFKITDMGKSPGVFDVEKFDYFNGYYIRQKSLDEITELCMPFLKKYWQEKGEESVIKNNKPEYIKKAISLEQERLKKLSEIGELTEFFFIDKLEYLVELLIWKKLSNNEIKNNLELVKKLLEKIPEKNWTNDSIEDALVIYLRAKELKLGDYLWPMRVALTGRKASPGPFDVAEALGKKMSLDRIDIAINKL